MGDHAGLSPLPKESPVTRMKLASMLAVAALVPAAGHVHAQTYPSKPVRIIVPFPPGGGIDLFARIIGQKISEGLGQQVVIDNRPGAQGNIGMQVGARAAPDGYTLTVAYAGTVAINPFLYKDPGFDSLKDFAPISLGTSQPEVLMAHPAVPAKDLKQLVALARAQPGKLTAGSSASTGQLVVELLKQIAKVDVLHVAYKGASFAATDLIAGYVDIVVASNAAAAPYHRSGKVKVLVVAGPERTPVLPDVPSAPEAGMPGLQVVGWYALVAPAGTPRDVITRLNGEIGKALAAPDVRERLGSAGLTPKASTPEELGALLRSDYERLGKVVKASGAKPGL
jgi:tripartite-type tricarboxylate transporter receptor subunit TctC